MENYREVSATTYIEIMMDCPHCDYYQNRFNDLVEYLDEDTPITDECDAVLECEQCGEKFMVTEVVF